MATITPTRSSEGVNQTETIVWSGAATGDTINNAKLETISGIMGCVQVTGTFGSATVVLQGSNDASNWVTLKDTTGTAISVTSDGMVDFSTACLYIRPGISGGTGDSPYNQSGLERPTLMAAAMRAIAAIVRRRNRTTTTGSSPGTGGAGSPMGLLLTLTYSS